MVPSLPYFHVEINLLLFNAHRLSSYLSFTPPPSLHPQEVKALVNAAEHEVHIAKDALKATEKAIEEAHERNRIAKATHDALIVKLKNVKAQFREQIMEDGLRESNRWNDMYQKLLAWKEANNGDVLVAVDKDSDEDTKKLSRWVINQRSSYKYFMNGDTKHIKDHRIDALNKVCYCCWVCSMYGCFSCALFLFFKDSHNNSTLATDWLHLECRRSCL